MRFFGGQHNPAIGAIQRRAQGPSIAQPAENIDSPHSQIANQQYGMQQAQNNNQMQMQQKQYQLQQANQGLAAQAPQNAMQTAQQSAQASNQAGMRQDIAQQQAMGQRQAIAQPQQMAAQNQAQQQAMGQKQAVGPQMAQQYAQQALGNKQAMMNQGIVNQNRQAAMPLSEMASARQNQNAQQMLQYQKNRTGLVR